MINIRFGNIIAVLVLIFLNVNTIYSQPEYIKFKNLNRNDGLVSNSITCIYQDRDGFMWIGTEGGLSRYDGCEFLNFNYDKNDTTTISSDNISAIIGDKDGNLWIGTRNGLNYYDINKQKITRVSMPGSTTITYLNYWNDNLLISTNRGIYKYNDTTLQIELLNNILVNYNIQSVYSFNKDLLLIGTSNRGLYVYDKTGKFRQVALNSKLLIDIRFIFRDSFGDVWVGSDLGLVELDGHTFKIKHTYSTRNTKFTSGRIHGMVEVSKGNFYIIERDGGLYFFKKNVGPVKFYTSDKYSKTNLVSKSVTTIYYSTPKIIWLGTYSGGLSCIDFNTKKFIHFKSNFKKDGIFNDVIRSMAQCANGDIWIGTKEGGGLSKFNKEKGTFVNIPHKKGDIHTPGDDYVLSIEEYNDRYLLLGTLKDGLNVYDRKRNIFKSYNSVDNGNGYLNKFRVYSIKKDADGKVWVGSIKSLQLFDFKTRKFKLIPNIPNVRVIHIVNKDTVWFAARETGLVIYSKKKGILRVLSHDENNPKSLPDNHITAIIHSKNSNYWFATSNGIAVYDNNLNFIRVYDKTNGLSSNKIRSMQEDEDGNMWASSNSGIIKIEVKDNIIKNYGYEDGLQSNDFEYYTSLKTNDGYMLFGGRNGFNMFKPSEIKDNKFIPPVRIIDFKLNNETVKVNGHLLSRNILRTDKINLNYNQNTISISFVALNYTSANKVKYKYKLAGFEKKWIDADALRTVSYTHLPPGRYTFMVKASNDDGIWGDNVKSIEIYIKPPIWETWWFYVLVILLLIGLVVLYNNIRLKKLKRQKDILEETVKKRTRELFDNNTILEESREEVRMQNDILSEVNKKLEKSRKEIDRQNKELIYHKNNLEKMVEERTVELKKALDKAKESDRLKSSFLANMSHEIRTPLNAIMGFSSLFKDDENLTKEEKAEYVDIINSKGELLMSIINDIIDISLIETGQVVIKKQSFDLQEVFKDLEFTYQFKHKGNGVKIEYENNKNEKITFFGDSTRIYQVFVNLLNNALKFTEEGSVKFGFKQKESEIEFYVKDTGIGIEEEDKDKVFKYFHKINPETKIEHGGLGIGLTISKHIVELMGGEMYLESEYGKGTTFYFSLPKEQHLANDIENNKKEIIINKESLPSLVDYKILIAEDDELNYKYYEVLFSKLDTTIVWFKNGLELVDYIKANMDIDKCIILMDIKMPVMDGVEAMKEVKKIRKDIPIIASTAHSLSTDKDNYIGMGFDDYMSKPINRERLVGVISAWV